MYWWRLPGDLVKSCMPPIPCFRTGYWDSDNPDTFMYSALQCFPPFFLSSFFCILFTCVHDLEAGTVGWRWRGKEGSLDECKICCSIWDAAPQPAKPKGNKKREGHSTASNLKATWRIVERGCVFKPLPPWKSIFVAPSNKQFHYLASPGEIKCHG